MTRNDKASVPPGYLHERETEALPGSEKDPSTLQLELNREAQAHGSLRTAPARFSIRHGAHRGLVEERMSGGFINREFSQLAARINDELHDGRTLDVEHPGFARIVERFLHRTLHFSQERIVNFTVNQSGDAVSRMSGLSAGLLRSRPRGDSRRRGSCLRRV